VVIIAQTIPFLYTIYAEFPQIHLRMHWEYTIISNHYR